MYTVDDQKNDLYEDELENDFEDSNWDNRKGLIFKIIIIILCVIVLIWLIKALRNNNNLSDNGEVHIANTEKIRLAAENYFFVKNNKTITSNVSIAGLKKEGLINDIVDANNKVCSDTGTNVSINKQDGTYRMVIDFSCSTNDQDEVFFYNYNTLACLNCNGKTNMTGKEIIIAKADEKKEESNNDNNNTPNDSDELSKYSCASWSDWSKDRINNKYLTERVKTLVQGVKYGTKTTYGEWSEYSTTPILSGEGVEIETMTSTENVWSETKTGTNINPNSSSIKVISSKLVTKTDPGCKNGYIENNVCYSNETKVSNLTVKEYNNGIYKILNPYCEGVKILQDKDGLYVPTYINCKYNVVMENEPVECSYVLYTYQELISKEVTYYRYRTVSNTNEPIEYTDEKYEESELPEGFVKVEGTEENYYSYKITECVK